MKNERGIGLVALLCLLPLLVTFLLGVGVLSRQLLQWGKLHHQCRLKVVKHQNQLRSFLLKLSSLNPKAQRLQTQKKMAQAAFIAALATGQPGAIKAAQSHLQRITSQQLLLDGKQRMLFVLAHAEARRFFLQMKMDQQFTDVRFKHLADKSSYPLAVQAHPPHSLAPVYLPAVRFNEKQALGITSNWSPVGLTPLKNKSQWRIECGATLTKEGKKWMTHLRKVNLS